MNQHVPESKVASAAGHRAKVFISYSRKDLAFAQMLVEALGERGFDAFLDKTDIAPGEPWQERLAGLIAATDTVVFAISPDSVASSICAWELEESVRLGKRLIPVVARRIPDADAPPALGRLNWVFCVEDDDKNAALAALETALRTDLPWVREHTRLGELARRWDEQGRGKGATLRGADLDAAERWLDRRPADANAPTELHQDFIRASRRAGTGRQRMWIGGSLAVAAVAIGVAVFAEITRREAQQQRDRAEHTLTLAIGTANSLVIDLAEKFRNAVGISVTTVKDIVDRARQLQDQLLGAGETAPELRLSQADALFEATRTLLTLGETDDAFTIVKQAQGIVQPLADKEPANRKYQEKLSFADFRLGDVLTAQGKLPDALQAYRTSLAISDRLAKSDPPEPLVLHDLGVIHQKIGLVLLTQNNLTEAEKSFRTSLEFFQQLAKEHPNDHDPLSERQYDLVSGYQKVGDVLARQNKLDDALQFYQDAYEIADQLMQSQPDKRSQQGLDVMSEKIGDVRLSQGNLPEALKYQRASLAITEELAKNDPDSTSYQRDLSFSYNKVGDVLSAQKDFAGALESYQAGLKVIERLSAKDPRNGAWQRDLFASYDRVGDAFQALGKFADALSAYQSDLEVTTRLADANPAEMTLQAYLTSAYSKLANAQGFGGDPTAALASLQAGFAIVERLATANPDDPSVQSQVAIFYSKLASFYKGQNNLSEMQKALEAGREIAMWLLAAHPDVAMYKQELDWFNQQMAAPKN
jgi:tetratricopeptide (TPR) repeat protein